MKTVPLVLLVATLSQIASADNTHPPENYNNDAPVFGHDTQLQSVKWKDVFNQLFYWNIQKYYPAKEGYTAEKVAEHSIYYSRLGFNEILNFVEGRDKNGNVAGRDASGNNLVNHKDDFAQAMDEALDFYDHPQGADSPLLSCNPDKKKGEEFLSEEAAPNFWMVPNACYLVGNRQADDGRILNGPFSQSRQTLASIQNIPGQSGAGAAATTLWSDQGNRYTFNTNYFQTPEGKMVANSLSDTVLVVIPGFGSHTIPDYTYPEIVQEANFMHGRPETRQVGDSGGADPQPTYAAGQSPGEFYASGPNGFDIVHPMGREMGDTMGNDDDVAQRLHDFLVCPAGVSTKTCLPASYANKKLILVGYSKGCPVAHNMVSRFKDVRDRTLAIVTIAGVNQGALPAEEGFRTIEQILKKNNPHDAMDAIKTGHIDLKTLSPKYTAELAALIAMGSGSKVVKQFIANPPMNEDEIVMRLNSALNTDQIEEALEGIYDMTQYQRLRWNLVHMNDTVFDDKINIFNLSVLANLDDFAAPDGWSNTEVSHPSSIFPQFKLSPQGKLALDEQFLSRDNLFLFFTSLSGFATAPGGMFDTQVAYADTKSLPLDDRSIYNVLHYIPNPKKMGDAKSAAQEKYLEQLSLQEITALAADVNKEREALGLKDLPPGFEMKSKRELITELGSMKNLNLVDLGDLRGTHWDTAFCEVYKANGVTKCKADDPEHYTHTFPRKAMLSALLETMAIYKSGLTTADSSKETPHVP